MKFYGSDQGSLSLTEGKRSKNLRNNQILLRHSTFAFRWSRSIRPLSPRLETKAICCSQSHTTSELCSDIALFANTLKLRQQPDRPESSITCLRMSTFVRTRAARAERTIWTSMGFTLLVPRLELASLCMCLLSTNLQMVHLRPPNSSSPITRSRIQLL